MALTEEDGSLVTRFGVSSDQVLGQGWKEISPQMVSMSDTVSINSNLSEVSDSIDGLSGDCVSIHPDVPEDEPFVDSDIPNAVGLCWVDGACISMLK